MKKYLALLMAVLLLSATLVTAIALPAAADTVKDGDWILSDNASKVLSKRN